MQRKRIVVTGLGTVNPLALNMKETWEKMLRGESGIDRIRSFNPDDFPGMEVRIAGELKGFDPVDYMGKKDASRMDAFSQYAIAATQEALANAELVISPEISLRMGVFIGTGVGGLTTITEQESALRKKGVRGVSALAVPKLMPNAAAGNVAMQFRIRGLSFAPTSACSSGADALGYALLTLRNYEDIEIMVAGGTEAAVIPLAIAAFQQIGALSKKFNDDPKKASRPFDAKRDGFVLGEGAAILILETLESALQRNAPVLAEFVGYGATSDAFHITKPDERGNGAMRAMEKARKDAGVSLEEITYINAHGTSTPLNDRIETLAIKNLFGERAYHIPISSTKGMTSHLVGAAGSLEACVCVRQTQTGWAPPTINYEFLDPECDLDYIPNAARKLSLGAVMSNSFGFGGHNSCLVFIPYIS